MRTILLALLLTSNSFGAEPRYDEAMNAKAIRENKTLVVFVGCEPYKIEDCLTCVADGLDGYPSSCIVISIPENGKLYWARTLAATEKDVQLAKPARFRDDLDEVNGKRMARGLQPLIRDDGLTAAAASAAQFRAANRIAGHTANDFAYLPGGSHATSAGCGALDLSWGWQSCCWDGNYTYAGASSVMGADGLRYMHIFVR